MLLSTFGEGFGVDFDVGFGVLFTSYEAVVEVHRMEVHLHGERADYAAGLEAFDAGRYDVALSHWRPLAEEANDALSQARIGDMYATGMGLEVDVSEAIRWFRMSADQDNPYGQIGLARLYSRGHESTRDYDEAVRLLEARKFEVQVRR